MSNPLLYILLSLTQSRVSESRRFRGTLQIDLAESFSCSAEESVNTNGNSPRPSLGLKALSRWGIQGQSSSLGWFFVVVGILSIWLRSNIAVDSHVYPILTLNLTLNMLPRVIIKIPTTTSFQPKSFFKAQQSLSDMLFWDNVLVLYGYDFILLSFTTCF